MRLVGNGRSQSGERGATLVDYALIVAIVAVFCITSIKGLRDGIMRTFCEDLMNMDIERSYYAFQANITSAKGRQTACMRYFEDEHGIDVLWSYYW